MRLNRREFIGTAVSAALVPLATQVTRAPAWVPAGFPPFYEDADFERLIVHKQVDLKKGTDPSLWTNDGGDTAQREGFTWFALAQLADRGIAPVVTPSLTWARVVALLEDPNMRGTFRRHPSPNRPDWSSTATFSRDQQTPMVAALGALGPKATLDNLWEQFDARGRVCQNGDSGGPDHQNLFHRARGQGQIESFGEFQLAMMVESLAIRGTADPDDVGDDLNFLVGLLASHRWRPTKSSAATLCEYVRTRPVNYGCYLERYRRQFPALIGADDMGDRVEWLIARDPRPECHPIVGALRWYFRTEAGAAWGPVALYEQVLGDVMPRLQCVAR